MLLAGDFRKVFKGIVKDTSQQGEGMSQLILVMGYRGENRTTAHSGKFMGWQIMGCLELHIRRQNPACN